MWHNWAGLGLILFSCIIGNIVGIVLSRSERQKRRKRDEAEKRMRALQSARDEGFKQGFESGVQEARKGGVYR